MCSKSFVFPLVTILLFLQNNLYLKNGLTNYVVTLHEALQGDSYTDVKYIFTNVCYFSKWNYNFRAFLRKPQNNVLIAMIVLSALMLPKTGMKKAIPYLIIWDFKTKKERNSVKKRNNASPRYCPIKGFPLYDVLNHIL